MSEFDEYRLKEYAEHFNIEKNEKNFILVPINFYLTKETKFEIQGIAHRYDLKMADVTRYAIKMFMTEFDLRKDGKKYGDELKKTMHVAKISASVRLSIKEFKAFTRKRNKLHLSQNKAINISIIGLIEGYKEWLTKQAQI